MFLNNSATVLLIDGSSYLEASQQLQFNEELGSIQKHIQVHSIMQKFKVAISEAKRTMMSKLVNDLNETVRCGSTFVKLMEKILNFCILFEKEYSEKFTTTRIVDIAKNKMGSDFLVKTGAYSY